MTGAFFSFQHLAAPEIYTLSLHDALPISDEFEPHRLRLAGRKDIEDAAAQRKFRSEEHTSELQSHHDLVCRLLLEKKKTTAELTSSFTNTTTASTAGRWGSGPTDPIS